MSVEIVGAGSKPVVMSLRAAAAWALGRWAKRLAGGAAAASDGGGPRSVREYGLAGALLGRGSAGADPKSCARGPRPVGRRAVGGSRPKRSVNDGLSRWPGRASVTGLVCVLSVFALRCPAATGNWPVGWSPSPDRFVDVFTPFRTDTASISRDGRYLAYSVRKGETLSVLVVPIDQPARASCYVTVGTDRTSTPFGFSGHLPARISHLEWARRDRLIVDTNMVQISGNLGGHFSSYVGRIFGVDADGKNARSLVAPRDLMVMRPGGEFTPCSPRMYGLCPSDPDEILVFGSRYYHADARTGKLHDVSDAVVTAEIAQMKTEFHRWANLRKAAAASLQTVLPGQAIEVLGNDDGGNRFLALARTVTNPGAFYIYDRRAHRAMQFVHRLPALDGRRNQEAVISFTAPDGRQLHAVLVLPRRYRVKPIPLVVDCPLKPDRHAPRNFQRDVQALAEMGFAVLLPDGFAAGRTISRNLWTTQAEHQAIGALLAAVDSAARHYPIDPRRAALFGANAGAFLALRALQLHPERFRCAVTFDPMYGSNPKQWMALSAADRAGTPESGHVPSTGRHVAVLMLNFYGTGLDPRQAYSDAVWLAHQLRDDHTSVDFTRLLANYVTPLRPYAPRDKATVFRQIESFLNAHLYDYTVKIGPTKVRS